jgi:uncharacterized membrane protein
VKRQYILIIMIFASILLSGCSFYHTQRIADSLNSSNLYSSFRTEPVDLQLYSKCDAPLVINIVNDEKRDDDFLIWDTGPSQHYIKPKELMNHIVKYMIDAFDKSKVKQDQSSQKQIKISLKRVNWIDGVWAVGTLVEIQIQIPEIKFETTYSIEEYSMLMLNSTAYAIHVLTWKMINDPVVKDYILCTKTTPIESPIKESPLDILKRRYASGEISREQFEQMKKDIE